MNLNKFVVSLVVCVAATVSLSACSGAIAIPQLAEKPAAEAPSTEPSEAGDHDEMTLWSQDRDVELAKSVQPELDYISEELDFGVSLELPGPTYVDKGWIGVAALRERCVLAVGSDDQSLNDGSLSVVILSRYDQSLTVTAPWSSDYSMIREVLDPYVAWCDGGPLPEIDEPSDDTSTTA